MQIEVIEPQYTGGNRRIITNTGDLQVLEGSSATWSIQTLATQRAVLLHSDDTLHLSRQKENEFVIEKRLFDSDDYQILLENEHSFNQSQLTYAIEVIKDEYPKITAEYFPDSLSYQFITVAGTIADDYGFSRLALNYRKSGLESFAQIPLAINTDSRSQSYYATWQLDSLDLKSGERVELYVTVSDNDRVNGSKTAKSNAFIFQVPSTEAVDQLISEKSDKVKDQLDEAKKDAEDISERLSEIEDRLKTEQKFDWQEKKLLEDVIEDREKLNEQLLELEKKNQELQNATSKFKKQSTQLQQKNEKLQELMKQLMDEETRKLYEKLKELMKQNAPKDQISEQLKQLQRNEQNQSLIHI